MRSITIKRLDEVAAGAVGTPFDMASSLPGPKLYRDEYDKARDKITRALDRWFGIGRHARSRGMMSDDTFERLQTLQAVKQVSSTLNHLGLDPKDELNIKVVEELLPKYIRRKSNEMKRSRRVRQVEGSSTRRRIRLSEGLAYHIDNCTPLDENVFRPGSRQYFAMFREARRLYREGLYTPLASEYEMIVETDLGEWGVYEGRRVPLDFPILEAKYKGKDVELNKPKRGSGGKAYVYVRDPKTKNIKKVTFGSSMPDAMGDSDAARKRRKSFGERHKCAEKKDKTKAGYWSCRATKFFGRDIPGWW